MWTVCTRDKPFLFALVAIALLLGAIVFDSHPPPQPQPQQQQACEECADKNQAKVPTLFGLGSNEYIAMFTAGTLGVLLFQAWAAFRANYHFQVTERAYVKMSHTPPGVKWGDVLSGGFKVEVRIKNFGSTPARVTDIYLNKLVAGVGTEMPEDPSYPDIPDRILSQAFLVAEEPIFQISDFAVSFTERAKIEAQELVLIVYGYVDYIDSFDQRHRGGYARILNPEIDKAEYPTMAAFHDRNNLPIFDHRGYNYDRLRKPGEGNDWPD